ncbi:Ig-like domain-containing protein, partial [Psychrobacter sp. 5A.1]|uniref:Ig-like domain-containing protein n=1 Tax=Psychrobacter sp. 5A.1 TaxID=3035207 RepID=UPI0025B3E43A
GFTGDPTPISYTVDDSTGLTSNEATVTIDYPQSAPVAVDDKGVGPLNTPVSVDILANDTDLENNIDPTSVKLINPDTGSEVTTVTVAGEGEWEVDPSTGVVTFTPETGFTADPTPVDYVVSDLTGNKSNPATIVVDYPPTAPVAVNEIQTGTTGNPVVVDVLSNDTDLDGDIDPTTVIITQAPAGSTIATDGKSVDVTGEGVWSVDAATGDITFTPEAGFTGDPTPISYTVDDSTGLTSNEATVTIDYPQSAPVAVDDSDTGTTGNAVAVTVVGNDSDPENDLDPTTVIITQAPTGSTIATDGKSVDVPGEGVWSVDAATGDITFTPEAGFTGDPTPISYTVDDSTGLTSNEATVTIDYPQSAPVAVNDSGTGTSGAPVVVAVVGNDSDPEND